MQIKNNKQAVIALEGLTQLYTDIKDQNKVIVVGVNNGGGVNIVENVKVVDVASDFGRVAVKLLFDASGKDSWFDTGQLYLYRVSDKPLTIVDPALSAFGDNKHE